MYMDKVRVPEVRQQEEYNNPAAQEHPAANNGEPALKAQPQPANYGMPQPQAANYGTPQPPPEEKVVQGVPHPHATVTSAEDPGHLVLVWVLFGVGTLLFPILLVVNAFLPCCRHPRFTKMTFIPWLLSLIMLVIWIIIIIVIAVVVSNRDGYDYYYVYK